MLKPLTVIISSLLLAACTVGPAYQRPDSPLPNQFDQASTEASEQSIGTGVWQAFADPALDRLLDRVLAENTSIAQAFARWEEVRALRPRPVAAVHVVGGVVGEEPALALPVEDRARVAEGGGGLGGRGLLEGDRVGDGDRVDDAEGLGQRDRVDGKGVAFLRPGGSHAPRGRRGEREAQDEGAAGAESCLARCLYDSLR